MPADERSSFDAFYQELLAEARDSGPRAVSEVYALGAVYSAGIDVRDRRISLGLSLQELSELTGIAVDEISRIESGQGNLTVGTLGALAHALRLEITLTPKIGAPVTGSGQPALGGSGRPEVTRPPVDG